MRLNVFIAFCVCVSHTRAATIKAPEIKLDALDDVNLDNVEQETVGSQQNLKKTDVDIPVSVVDERVVNENSNDYVPDNDDNNINVKRIEVDLRNPGPPQRQEHETQNPESYSDREKAIFAIKSSIENAEKVVEERLQVVSDGFKTIFSPEENLSLIQKNINNLKETFTGEIAKINYAIRTQLKPQTVPVGQKSENNIEIAESRLKILEKNFVSDADALSKGVELYSIIKEENAGKTAAVKADIENTEGSQPSSSSPAPTHPSNNQPITGTCSSAFQCMITNMQNTISSLQGIIYTIFPGQPSQSQTNPSQPSNVQSDTPVSTNPTQAIINNIPNGFPSLSLGQNNQQGQNNQPNNNFIQQLIQNVSSFFTQPAQVLTNNNAPTKQPESSLTKKPESDEVQSANTEPARIPAVAPIPQAPASQQAISVPAQVQPGPIQQLVQNNPIIKGLQSAVQRIQGTPNPETPREEAVQDAADNEDGNVDSKGHYGGNRPNNVNNVSQGGTNDSGRVEEKVEEVKAENITAAKDIAEEKIIAEQLKTPAVSDKNEQVAV